jgi:O-antigen/teichoic acid export membrane protein
LQAHHRPPSRRSRSAAPHTSPETAVIMVALQIDTATPAKPVSPFRMFDRRLNSNLLALYLLQAANYLAPMATLPWLTRVLGADSYGQMGLTVALIAYAAIFIDYGFSLSATKKIAVNRDDRVTCSAIFWSTLASKGLLFIAAMAALLILTLVVPRFAELRGLILIGSLTLVGTVLTPIWYYQGIERMQSFASLSALARIVSIPLVFLCVTSPDDIAIAVLIQAGTYAVIGIATLLALIARREVLSPNISFAQCRDAFKDGAVLFFANAGVSLYTAANIVILGVVSTNEQVGYFAGSMAIMRAVNGLMSPFAQALYPRMSYLMAHDRKQARAALRPAVAIVACVSFTAAVVLFFGAGPILSLLLGSQFANATPILRWLAPTVFIVSTSNMLGIQIMLPLGYQKPFTTILLISGVFNVLLLFPLAHLYGGVGAAITVFMIETIVTVAMFAFLYRKHPGMLRTHD